MAEEVNKSNEGEKDRSEKDVSLFRLYAYGHAVEDRAKNSRMLKVHLSEMNPTADGEMGFSGTEVTTSGKDINDKETQGTLRSENSIDCDWMPMESNKLTPPDIVKGEPILVYRYGDDRQYYWKETGTHRKYRKLETSVYGWSSNPEGNDDKPENHYYLEVSTDRKLITLQTTKNNGEPFATTLQLNLGEGTFHFADDTGNQLEIDFNENHFRYENADTSAVDLTKDHYYVKNKTGSTVDVEGDHIFAKNNTGSNIDIQGDIITTQNLSGSKTVLDGGKVLHQDTIGDKITMENGTIHVQALIMTNIQGGSHGLLISDAGVIPY